MKYYITYAVEARYCTEVEADNMEEAMAKAEENWFNADFGEAKDVDGEQIVVEVENRDCILNRECIFNRYG